MRKEYGQSNIEVSTLQIFEGALNRSHIANYSQDPNDRSRVYVSAG